VDGTRCYIEDEMVAQQVLQSFRPSDETLAAVWRAATQRVTLRVIVLFVGLGSGGAVALVIADRFLALASMCVVIAAFGGHSAVLHPSLGGRRLRPGTQRFLGVLTGAVAALAGVVAGLLVLAAVFSGSIEVMRR
jgi:hypothetical protein